MKKEYTEEQARTKAEAYCVAAERCTSEVETKLQQWGMDPEAVCRIIDGLVAEKYIDERRYCAAFVRDKYRFNQWGRVKIAQALRMKQIAPSLIEEGMEAIDEAEYARLLASLLAQKRKTVKAATDYERNGKLIRFAVGRGFAVGEVMKCLGCTEEDYACID